MDEPDQKTVLQQADPFLGGPGGHPGVTGEVAYVEDLTGPQGTHPDEDLEFPPLLDTQQLADITLDGNTRLPIDFLSPSRFL